MYECQHGQRYEDDRKADENVRAYRSMLMPIPIFGHRSILASASGCRPSQPLHQIHNPHAEGVREDLQRLKGDVALPTFDFSDVRPVQSGAVCEHVLGPAPLQA